jgi:transcriptional regulator with XRE-family HTH domain
MAQLLRTLRQRAGLTVEEAAARIGVTRATVYAWEAGDKEPDKDSLRAAATAYDATEDERVRLAVARAFGVDAADAAV